MKHFLLILLAALLAFGGACAGAETVPVPIAEAADTATEEAPALSPEAMNELLIEMAVDAGYYGSAANDRVREILDEVTASDPVLGEKWTAIMDYWVKISSEGATDVSAVTDRDAVLCFAVVGYELTPQNGIQKELKRRLETAKKCLGVCPNSYILCSGKGRRSIPEATMMRKWLIEHGVPKDRILVEDESWNTCQNAQYSMKVLKDHPEITGVVTVTGASHAHRVALSFEAARILSDETLPPVIGRVSSETTLKEDSARLSAGVLVEMLGNKELATSINRDTYKPPKLAE